LKCARCKLLTTGLRFCFKYLSIALLILIIEGTFRQISVWLLVLYIGLRVYMAFRVLDKAGHIDHLGRMIFGGERKR